MARAHSTAARAVGRVRGRACSTAVESRASRQTTSYISYAPVTRVWVDKAVESIVILEYEG